MLENIYSFWKLQLPTTILHTWRGFEIKARWRSGPSFKYSWVCEGGKRWEKEFWNWTCRMTSLPHPNSDSKQVWTHSKCRDGQHGYLLKWSLSENITLSHFILVQSNHIYEFYFYTKKGAIWSSFLVLLWKNHALAIILWLLRILSFWALSCSLAPQLTPIKTCLLYHKKEIGT